MFDSGEVYGNQELRSEEAQECNNMDSAERSVGSANYGLIIRGSQEIKAVS